MPGFHTLPNSYGPCDYIFYVLLTFRYLEIQESKRASVQALAYHLLNRQHSNNYKPHGNSKQLVVQYNLHSFVL